MRFLRSVLLLPCLAAFPQARESATDEAVLSRATSHIAESIGRLTNYTCVETIDREKRPAEFPGFARIDLVRLEVAKTDGKELFAWPGARKFQNRPIGAFVPGGLIGDGAFSLFAEDLFVNGVGSMHVHGREQLQGRAALRVDYKVLPTKKSAFKIATEDGTAALGYSGSWWADPDSLDLIRLDIGFDSIPSRLRLSQAKVSIEYGTIKAGNRDAIMPQSSVIEFTYRSGAISRDGIEFTRCREFSGQTSIVFDGEDSRSASTATDDGREPGGKTFVLPNGLTIPLRLRMPIDPGVARTGDEITAIVDDDVRDSHRVWLPQGSVAHGRIRRIEQRREEGARAKKTDGYVLVGIEFSEVEVGHDTAEFAAELQSAGMSGTVEMNHTERQESTEAVAGKYLLFRYLESFDREIPGVGYLYITSAPFRIPAGLQMVWRTEPLRESDWR